MENLLFNRRGSIFAKKSAVDLTDVVDVFTHRCHDCAALLSSCGYLFLGSLINEGRFLRCLIDRNDSQFRRYMTEKLHEMYFTYQCRIRIFRDDLNHLRKMVESPRTGHMTHADKSLFRNFSRQQP